MENNQQKGENCPVMWLGHSRFDRIEMREDFAGRSKIHFCLDECDCLAGKAMQVIVFSQLRGTT